MNLQPKRSLINVDDSYLQDHHELLFVIFDDADSPRLANMHHTWPVAYGAYGVNRPRSKLKESLK